MFHMTHKQTPLVEVQCTLISLNFYLFQNNFATLRGTKWVLFHLKRFLLEAQVKTILFVPDCVLFHQVFQIKSTQIYFDTYFPCISNYVGQGHGVYRKLHILIGGQRAEKFENHWFKATENICILWVTTFGINCIYGILLITLKLLLFYAMGNFTTSLMEEQWYLQISLVQRNTEVKIRKIQIICALRCHWTCGNLPVRSSSMHMWYKQAPKRLHWKCQIEIIKIKLGCHIAHKQ